MDNAPLRGLSQDRFQVQDFFVGLLFSGLNGRVEAVHQERKDV
ncbi:MULTISPECIES: hypothetical protein [Prochlorococcus]|nr:hypothetical protein [Prochlorococcus marinus]